MLTQLHLLLHLSNINNYEQSSATSIRNNPYSVRVSGTALHFSSHHWFSLRTWKNNVTGNNAVSFQSSRGSKLLQALEFTYCRKAQHHEIMKHHMLMQQKSSYVIIKPRSSTCASSSSVKSFLILNVLRISSGVFPLIMLATVLHVTSSKPLMSK